MKSYVHLKDSAVSLRRNGKTYTEIQEILGIKIPPSTLCTWFHNTTFSEEERARIVISGKERIRAGHLKTITIKALKRRQRDGELFLQNIYLKDILKYKDVAKISLAMLYLCEGSKHRSASVCFGNSNAGIIRLFLHLLRACYLLDERKLHATVQCRADQDGYALTLYWSEITQIPLDRFYDPQIDKRTIGFPTKKLDYKGVCRVEYFSAATYNELKIVGEVLTKGL